mmetsp:Transcript_124398/g.278016  ORF Transcript_124398/g.278016 Transcript_124398/m.278016 type:complete len:453 (-) Transcript_124398:5-1363(-)
MARFLFALVGGLTSLAGAIQSPLQIGGAKSLTMPEAPHFWSCKNGNVLRNGVSLYSAPANLTTPLWEWTVPGHTQRIGHVATTPLIDRNSNVYIETTDGGIYAVARDGTPLWNRSESSKVATGALDGDSLYTGTSAGEALSIDLATGKENWRQKYSKMAGIDGWTVTAVDGMAILAATSGRLLTVAGGNDEIVALNTTDGSEKWRYKLGQVIINFMPAVVDNKLMFIDINGRVYCLCLSDGTLQWRTEGSPSGFTSAGLAVGPNGLAYTNFNTQGAEGGVLKAYAVQTGAERWSRNLGLEASAAPVVGRLGLDAPVGVVVGLGHNVGPWHADLQDAKGQLRAFDAMSGEDLWTFTTPSQMLHGSAGLYSVPFEDTFPDTWSTSAIGNDGTIYVGWEGGKQFSVEGATGRMISSHFTGWGDMGEPAIGDGLVVIPTLGKVVAFGTTESRTVNS